MRDRDTHLSDPELLLASDGELSDDRRQHLNACPNCRARQQQLEDAVVSFARMEQRISVPPPDAPRARLRAHLTAFDESVHRDWLPTLAVSLLALIATAGVLTVYHAGRSRPIEIPSPRLTPGAVRAVNQNELCNSALPKDRPVPVELRRRVFRAYGIADSDPRAYEVDYLITPALGGADDIRNLWPQPYRATVWNARVKDALEDHLRDLVCGGQLDLAEAQRALSSDWIAAYKKYFRTNEPAQEDADR